MTEHSEVMADMVREADLYVSAIAFNDLIVFTQAVTNDATPAAIDNGSMVGRSNTDDC
jgi:hypothetical protein